MVVPLRKPTGFTIENGRIVDFSIAERKPARRRPPTTRWMLTKPMPAEEETVQAPAPKHVSVRGAHVPVRGVRELATLSRKDRQVPSPVRSQATARFTELAAPDARRVRAALSYHSSTRRAGPPAVQVAVAAPPAPYRHKKQATRSWITPIMDDTLPPVSPGAAFGVGTHDRQILSRSRKKRPVHRRAPVVLERMLAPCLPEAAFVELKLAAAEFGPALEYPCAVTFSYLRASAKEGGQRIWVTKHELRGMSGGLRPSYESVTCARAEDLLAVFARFARDRADLEVVYDGEERIDLGLGGVVRVRVSARSLKPPDVVTGRATGRARRSPQKAPPAPIPVKGTPAPRRDRAVGRTIVLPEL